ncbi:uncharacterized protein LOC109604624 [Aethina tumida]|uniref:uncharacterized protein LOC109604624 n=1 Tax=Aethina tumida TaxID=116153 RepID=UPI0021479DDD|nr:uncharacterized protein LOC109604624 [Aethina tumida]
MVEKLTDEQIEEYKEAFALFDEKEEGKIAVKDIGTVMRSLGFNPSEKELAEIVKSYSAGDTIYFPQFLRIMATRITNQDWMEDAREVFKQFDINQTGFIQAAQLRYILLNLGEKMTEEEVAEVLREADIDQDGQINYEDFIASLADK